MIINKIIIKGFGPFKEERIFDFSNKDMTAVFGPIRVRGKITVCKKSGITVFFFDRIVIMSFNFILKVHIFSLSNKFNLII